MRVCKQQGRVQRPVRTLTALAAALFLTFGTEQDAQATDAALLPLPPASVLPLHVGGLFGGGGSSEEPAPQPQASISDLTPAAAPRVEQPVVNPLEALTPYLPEPGQWRQVPDLRFDRFGLTEQEANALGVRGNSGSAGVLGQQTGSAYDPEGFLWYFWGGGGNAYGGNEVYRLDLTLPLMSQITQPSILDAAVQVPNANGCLAPSDGPAAASTFDGFVWSPGTQSFFVFPSGGYCPGGAYNPETVWEFDPLSGLWDPVAGMAGLDGPAFAEYDPATGLIFVIEAGTDATLRNFDPVTGQLGARVSLGQALSSGSAVLDSRTDEMIVFAQQGVFAVSLVNPGTINRLADVPSGFDTNSGAALDSQSGVVALWDGGKNVRSFTIATGEWTEETASSGPTAGPGGVFSKWVAIKELGIFAGYQNPAEGLWLYRLPTTLTPPPPVNNAPVALLGASQVAARTGNVVNLNGAGSFDPDGDALTYSWSTVSSPAGISPVLTTPNQATTSFTPAVNGGYVIRLTVSDGVLSDTATATVTAGNTVPVAEAGPNQTVQVGQTVTLNAGGSSDADSDTLSYSWSFTSVPSGSGATLSGAQSVAPSFVPDKAGTYRLSLTVSDGIADAVDTTDVSATAVPNRAPFADAGPDQTRTEGQTVTLSGLLSSDPDNDTLFYTWTLLQQPTGSAASLSNTAIAQPTLTLDVAGDYVARLVVDDGTLSSSPDDVVITAGIDTGPAGGDSTLVANWEFDENAGSTASDSSGNANGTIFGASWTTGATGSALSFGGSDYIVTANDPALNVTGNAITLAAWIKPSDGGHPDGSRMISKRTDAGGCDVYSMFTLDNKFRFRLDCQDLISSSSFTPNGWIHVAMVYDGTDKRIYVNGVLDQGVQTKTDAIDSSSRPVYLGMREDEGRYFTGQMDGVRVYNRALSAAEVVSLFNDPALPSSQLATIDPGNGGSSGGGSATPPPSTSTVNVAFTASPLVVAPGQSTTLSWSSTNATSCTASGGWTGGKALSGSQTVSPSQMTTYSLSCTGSSGSAQSGMTVMVGNSTNVVDNLQPGQWYEAPNSRMDAVNPCPSNNCSYSGGLGFRAIMDVWNGGAYDTRRDRLIIWGGGHQGYAGNELYAFDVNSLQWQQLTTPSTSAIWDTAYGPDGLPSSRHTYDSIEYLPTIDRFCSVGGAALWGTGNGISTQFDCYSFENNQWERRGRIPSGTEGIDNVTGVDGQGNLWTHGTGTGTDRLAKYDPRTNTWTAYTPNGPLPIRYVAAVDSSQNKMYAVGEGKLLMWDLNNPNAPRQTISTSGATEILGATYLGVAYHPPSGKLVAWDGGASVYLFDPQTRVWTRESPAAGNSVVPTSGNANGTFGRFRYVPSKDVFIAVNRVNENVYFYRLKSSSGSGTPPTPAPTVSLSASPISINSGQPSVLTWSSTNAASCSANGGWTSSTATSGSQSISPNQTGSYTMTCSGSGGSTSQSVTVTVVGGVPVGSADFAARCADPNVVQCVDFDFQADVVPYIQCGETCPEVDNLVYAGGGGSLKMTIPSNSGANSSGTYSTNFTPGTGNQGESPAYPIQFGEGQEFFVQWRQRFSANFLNTEFNGGGGWKQANITEGDRPGFNASSCTQLEMVVQNTSQRGFPQMYHSCGGKDSRYESLDVGYGGFDFDLQPPNACLYSDSNAGNLTDPPCVFYYPDEWMTFQVRIKVGTWYKNNKNYCTSANRIADAQARGIGSACSTVEMWVSREGQPPRLALQRTDYDIANNSTEALYGSVWLLPYHTGKSSSQVHPTAYTWYDELIISTARIAEPVQ